MSRNMVSPTPIATPHTLSHIGGWSVASAEHNLKEIYGNYIYIFVKMEGREFILKLTTNLRKLSMQLSLACAKFYKKNICKFDKLK